METRYKKRFEEYLNTLDVKENKEQLLVRCQPQFQNEVRQILLSSN